MFSKSLISESIEPVYFKDSQLNSGERFLKFPLNERINSLLALSDLQGTIKVDVQEIFPVPDIAKAWLGITNWRGEAVWILDLAEFLGDVNWYSQPNLNLQGMAILIQVKHQTIGLLVKQIDTIESYRREELMPVMDSMIGRQRKFFQGYFLNSQGEPLMLLNIASLTAALS